MMDYVVSWLSSPTPEKIHAKPNSSPSQKRTEFVLVLNKKHLDGNSLSKITTFVFNLFKEGFEIDIDYSTLLEDIIFVRIHAPEQVALQYAEIFGIELDFQNLHFKLPSPKPYKFMGTELTFALTNGSLFKRARATIEGLPLTQATSAEKGKIIYKALTVTNFGEEREAVGLDKLLSNGDLECAYPVHDGPYQWSEEGALNDRQLLTKYWSSWKCFYKQQPLDLIYKYFGSQAGFYFAWLGFFNKMLIFAAISGVLSVFIGGLIFLPSFRYRSNEICQSDIILCPRCLVKYCKYDQLKNSCFHAYVVHLFDNPLVAVNAILMSVWSAVFLEMWKREEKLLQIRWNLRYLELDYSIRPEYEIYATDKRKSKITGTMEPYMPKSQQLYRLIFSKSLILLLLIIVLLILLGILIYIRTINIALIKAAEYNLLPKNILIVASCTSTIISVAIIILFTMIYQTIAFKLTQIENPRTQVEFDNAYIYKSFSLAFVTNFSFAFYLVFLKTKFYTYPGDEKIFTVWFGLASDLCNPNGCYFDIAFLLLSTMFGKKLCFTTLQYLIPVFQKYLKKRKIKKTEETVIQQWESDYLLNPMLRYHFMNEYIQMVIEYAYVIFFIAAFPLAPLFALINNLIELRIDAFKLTCSYRRPIAYRVANIAAWNGILQTVTYIAVVTNAFILAFSSEIVQREVYRWNSGSLVGFINSTLSLFNTSEFPSTFQSPLNISFCYYPGKRFSPDHPKRYQLTDEFWFELAIKFVVVVVFEHVVMFITRFVTTSIPNVPFIVKQYVNRHDELLKEVRLKEVNEKYLKQHQNKVVDLF